MNSPQKWSLTPSALERLLGALASDRVEASHEYEDLRRRLTHFFEWRGSASSETDADETLDRVARKLEQGEVVQNLRAYARGVAANVFQEAQRRRSRERIALRELATTPRLVVAPDDVDLRLPCLRKCLKRLSTVNRSLLVAYYDGDGRCHLTERKGLAARLGMTYSALKARAHRVRGLLEECLRECLDCREK